MAKRYAWLGTTRKGKVRDIVSSRLEAWLRDWCLQHETSETAITTFDPASCPVEECATWMVEAAGGQLLVAMDRGRLGSFGGRLVLADAEQSDGMAAELACTALQDLLARLAEAADLSRPLPVAQDGAWPDSILHPQWGGLRWQISFDGFEWMIGMDRAAVDALCPARTGKSGALSSRMESLDPLPVTLSAVLDFGSVNARDLAGLRVGEVLVSEHGVGQPIALRVGSKHVFDANLAQVGGRFAVVAAAASTGGRS